MVVRAINSRTLFLSASSSPLATAMNYPCQYMNIQRHKYSKLSSHSSVFWSQWVLNCHGASIRCYSVQSLIHMVVEECGAVRKRGRIVSVSSKIASTGEVIQTKREKLELQKGLLVEFEKDSERELLAVTQKPDGKKNWMVFDQNGVTSSIKPQQITFIIPGIEGFDHTEILGFRQRAEKILDPTLLEFAWIELLEKNKSVTVQELAEMVFGSADPLESYCAHLLLSNDEFYFIHLDTKDHMSIYGPRPAVQVQQLVHKKLAEEASKKEFQNFINMLKSAKRTPCRVKPPRSSWRSDEKIWYRIESLHAYVIDNCVTDNQKKTAELILKEMGVAKTSSASVKLLIDIGYFPVHVNLDLLKHNIRINYPKEVLAAAENVLSESYDQDKHNRIDLTHLKVYAIDVDEADE